MAKIMSIISRRWKENTVHFGYSIWNLDVCSRNL